MITSQTALLPPVLHSLPYFPPGSGVCVLENTTLSPSDTIPALLELRGGCGIGLHSVPSPAVSTSWKRRHHCLTVFYTHLSQWRSLPAVDIVRIKPVETSSPNLDLKGLHFNNLVRAALVN